MIFAKMAVLIVSLGLSSSGKLLAVSHTSATGSHRAQVRIIAGGDRHRRFGPVNFPVIGAIGRAAAMNGPRIWMKSTPWTDVATRTILMKITRRRARMLIYR